MSKMATIAADVDKKRVLCRISLKILRDKFNASEENPMRSITQHRVTIEEAARKRIEYGDYEEDGSILIQACDL